MGLGVFFLSGGVELTVLWSWEVIVEEDASEEATTPPLTSRLPVGAEAPSSYSILPSPLLAPPPLASTRAAQEEGVSSTEVVALPQPAFVLPSLLPVTIAHQVGQIAKEAWWRISDLGLRPTSLTRGKRASVRRVL